MNSSIFIEYETKTREFDGKLLLISHLLNLGFKNIYFGTAMVLRKEALLQKNGIYFFKSLSVKELSFYQKLKDRGFTLCLIHAEGGIYYKDSSSSIESMFNKKALDFFDFNFVLGNEIKENIAKVNGAKYGKKCYVTGEPRFDLLKPEYNSFFKEDIMNNKKLYGEFILINTSFSASNPTVGTKVLRDYWLNEPSFSKKTKELLMFKMDFFKKVIAEYLIAIELLSLKNPTMNFIIRPHPSESLKLYKDRYKNHKNIYVTNEGNVAFWIASSKGVIHYDCTTGIESLLAKKPVISYTPTIDKSIVAWLPIAVSNNLTNIKELQAAANSISRNNYDEIKISNEYNLQLENIISNFFQKSSPIIAKTLYDNIENMFFKDNLTIRILRFKNTLYFNTRTYFKKWYYKIKGIDDTWRVKAGIFNRKEIDAKLKKINTIEDFDFMFSVKKHSNYSCRIEIVRK